MNFKGFFKNAGNAFLNYAPLAIGVANAVIPADKKTALPLIGTVVNAIGAARLNGGSGQQQLTAALQNLQVAAPYIIQEIETTFGIDVPDEAVEPYIKGMIQLHYDLLRAAGKIAPTK